MKILSIGNSFSQDAQRYLHRLAKHEGVDMKTVNLYIGGCPLRTHYLNILDDTVAYEFQFNGQPTGLKVSIRQALRSDSWDYVTIQQASHDSARFATYEPYLETVAAYVKKYCPTAKLLIHQTWAYENGSQKLINQGFATDEEMFAQVEKAYEKAREMISADGLIPAGKAMLTLSKAGLPVHRDTYHANFGYGRYLLALVWFKYLTGRDISTNDFNEFDVPVTDEQRKAVIDAVNGVFA
jgi:hypothetical protein